MHLPNRWIAAVLVATAVGSGWLVAGGLVAASLTSCSAMKCHNQTPTPNPGADDGDGSGPAVAGGHRPTTTPPPTRTATPSRTATPTPNVCEFEKDTSASEVVARLGEPNARKEHCTWKCYAVIYSHQDAITIVYYYRGRGRLVFDGYERLIDCQLDPNETGFAPK